MTINPSTVGHDTFDLLDGSLSSFYADVDEAIVASEVVKGQYRMTINPAYNSPNPVDSNSFTTVGLTQSGPMVVDLENSYITTEVELDLSLLTALTKAGDTAVANANMGFFVGWKSSIEAVERYDILVNSTPIYTQSFTGEESFIQYQVVNDMVKHTSPFIYTTYENASKMSPNVCGTYIVLNAGTATAPVSSWKGVRIPIKIPITNFLILKNLKYLISWMGKWEIRLYFSWQNLVVLPIDPAVLKATTGLGTSAAAAYSDVSHCFHQSGEQFDWVTKYNVKGKNGIVGTKMTLQNVEMNTAQFQLRMDILEMLKQKYLSEKPLTFPVSTLQISRFTGPPTITGNNSALSIVLCQAINNCDTMFVLPYRESSQHTVCFNPYIQDLQLHAGEYGAYPTQPFSTYATLETQNIRFVNSVADGLNVNASDLTSFSRDIARTFVINPFIQYGADIAADGIQYKGPNGDLGDRSNFFIPFPFSTDDDFQGGLSSPSSNINFKLTGNFQTVSQTQVTAGENDWAAQDHHTSFNTPWVAAFLIDGVIMIRPDPGSDAAKVIWSDRTVC